MVKEILAWLFYALTAVNVMLLDCGEETMLKLSEVYRDAHIYLHVHLGPVSVINNKSQ